MSEPVNGSTALLTAAFTGNSVMTKTLVDVGTDINAETEDRHTHLHRAASDPDTGCIAITLLVSARAIVNKRIAEG